MMSRLIKEFISSSQNSLLHGFAFITAIFVSLYLAFFLNSSDSNTILMIITYMVVLFLALIVFHSTNTWIPILICLLLVRDFKLGSLIGDGSLKIGDIFIAYVFSLWLIREVVKKNSTRFLKSKLDLFIILFISLHIFSLFWSTDIEYGLVRVFKLVRNFMFYIIIRELFITNFMGSYKKATLFYIVTAIALLIVHFSVVLSGGGFSDFLSFYQKETLTATDLGALRVRGTGGGFLISGPAMWFTITAILVFGSLTLRNTRAVRKLKIFLIMMFLLGVILTLQRSSMVMVIIMIIFLLAGSLYLKSKRNIILICIMLFVFAVIGSALRLGGIYEKRFENAFKSDSWTSRTDFYASAIDAFRQSPLLGIGVGSNYSWQKNYPDIGGGRSRVVHSVYFLVLSELGISGLIIFMVIIFLWLKYLFDCIMDHNYMPYLRSICMAFLAFGAGYLVYIVQVGEFEEFEVWLVMAIASAIKNLNSPAVGMVKDYSNKWGADV